MLPKNSRHVLYALLLLTLSVVCTSAVANTRVFSFIAKVASTIETTIASSPTEDTTTLATNNSISKNSIAKSSTASAAMFITIIQGADEELVCADDGSTVAKFNLCGDSDDRIISVSTGGSLDWQQVTGGCTPDLNTPCPDGSCSYTSVGSGSTFTIDASTIPAATGAEFRVRVNGSGPWYYFEVAKSTITQTHVKTDYICGVDGRIQITGLSSAYEFSIDSGSGFGPWQGPIFDNLTPGFYNVKARQQGTPGACEYPYEPIEIVQQDIAIDVTFVDAQCSGDNGSVTVNVNNSVPGPYKYTLLDNNGVPQEFTAFLPADNYTFSAVGFGTYIVQVETQQCTGDPINGIDPPRQPLDTGGNPIVIGNGLVALDASTEVNSSFGCSTITSVDITLNASGGSAPYTYTVNGGPVQPSFTGSTTYTVTAAQGAGSYDFLITDSNGCTIQASSSIEDLAPPTVTASGVDGTCSNGGARINFNIVNANGYNLSYRVNAVDPWDTNPSISVPATPGGTTYTGISVRYQQGGFECTLDLPDITVTSVGVVVGSATKIADRTCDGAGGTIGGRIDFGAASGGSGSGYVFSIDGLNFSGTTSFTGLVPGTYTPMIEDGGGCRLELTPITILDIDPPTDIDFISTNSNCAANTVDLQLVPTSNAAIVNYSIISPAVQNNGGSDTFVALDASQSYIFQITDANNCTYTEGYSPAIISTIRARVKSGGDTQICTGASDGSGAFLIDGFANTYQYQINAGAPVTGQSAGEVPLTGLGAGTYTITITDEDTGCTDTASFTVSEPATPLSLLGTVTPMSCNNGNLGRVVANPTGGWGNNRYTLTYPNGATTVGPKTGPVFGALSAPSSPGNPYTLLVEDAEGCTATFTFDLTPIDSPTIALDAASSDFCYVPGTGATMVVTSTAGSAAIGTHQYRVNGGALQGSPTFTNLSPGNYSIEVVDGNNCSDNVNVTVRPQLRVNTSIVTAIPCGGANGSIQVSVSGGYLANPAPKFYEVSSDNGGSFAAPVAFTANSFPYDTNVPGTYIFRVSDNEGCLAESTPIILDPPVSIDPATVAVNPVSCGNTSNGVVTITPDATSGIPPYEISFNGSAFTPQTVYSNLPVGTYPFIVRDARGCETVLANAVVALDATPSPDATVSELQATCSAGNIVAGGIQIDNVVNGTENFSFIIEDSFGNELARADNVARATLPLAINDPSLVPGDYTIITLDANGCQDIDTMTITTADVVITPINFTPAVTCDDTSFTYTVQVTPTISPVVPTYEIRIQGQPTFHALDNSFGPDTHTFSNATDGIQYGVAYTVEVLAPNGCIYEQEIPPIDGFSDIDITATSGSAFCDDNGNGQTDFTVVDFIGPNLTIELIDPSTNTVLDTDSPTGLVGGLGSSYSGVFNRPPGAYRILVTDTDGCTDAVNIDIILDAPRVDVLSNVPANCNALGQITFIGSGGTPFVTPASPYLYAVVPQGNPVDEDGTATPADPTDDFTDETTRILAGSLTGITYDIWVLDSRGCTFNVSQEVVQLQPNLGSPTFVVDNQCAVASPSFDIVVSVPATVDTPRFTLGGDEQLGVLNGGGTAYEYTYTVSTPGNYIVDVVDANGCTGQGTAVVYEFLSASGGFSTEPSCNNADGEVTIIPLGGSGDFDYALTGTDYLGGGVTINQTNNAVFTGMAPGDYQVVVTDRLVTDGVANCTFLVDNIFLEAATPPILETPSVQNVTCFGDDDGSIDVSLQVGTDVDTPIVYNLLNFTTRAVIATNGSGSFPDLPPLTDGYEVEVVTNRNCSDLSGRIDITEPVVYTISAAAPDFTCEPGANRFSSTILTATITSPGTAGNYRYSITGFENYQTSPTFEIVDDGSVQNITVYSIDDNGCQATASVTINPPMNVVPSIVQIDPLNCRDPERVRIEVIGTTDFTVSTVSAIAVAPVTNNPGDNFVDVFLPASGDYLFEVQDNLPLGCAYPMPVHTVVEPTQPTVVIAETEPIGCFGASDGEMSIEVTNYTGLYSYTVYSGSDPGKTTPLATGNLDTANNPETITGLAGGNFFVEVTSTATPFCSAESNIATIRTPNGALAVSAVEVGNVSCNNNTGIIEATGVGGWDTSAYEYRLLESPDGIAPYAETVPYAASNQFTGLSFGFYQVEIRDVEGCTSTFDIELQEVPQIDAGIREPLALQCPNGNNAILEAYDPTTGDATTATAGATGGFPGAGYTYRLLYLNSNDNTDIASSSGLQNTPTFIGATGGFISEGWYAIEVTSSFDCSFVTVPYYVDPPPPIEPRLAQTRVPGCGGNGQIRLFIDNHDPLSNFEYEYRQIPTPDPINDPWTDMGVGITEVFFDVPGSPAGISYQYEVRKKNAANTCLPVNTNGITLTDASDIQILPNAPIDNISCNGELDGRIEAFTFGGVGGEIFAIYTSDPVDGFNSGSAALYRPTQSIGTFEGLEEGTYWIGVVSGMTCEDSAGPFVVDQPEPIVYTVTPMPTTCNGATDGQIALEVTSGGVGLIQFAIAPNFNEFFSDVATPGIYTFDELAAGSYEVLIQDENGCFERTTVDVPEPEIVSANLVDVTPETCIGFADGTAQISVVGGTPFVDSSTFATYYETRLIGPNSDGSEVFVRNDNLYFDNLIGGESYIVFIRDANDCPTDIIIPVEIGVDLTATPNVVYGCEGIFPNSTASVTMLDTSLLPDLLFALDPVDPTDAISSNAGTQTTWGDLPAGDHTVYIYHQNGCTNSVMFTTEVYEPLTLTAEKTGPNEVTALAEGGYGNYEYFFQGESTGTDTVYTQNENGVVNIEVRDEGGCVATIAIPFEFTGMLEIPNFFTPDGDNNNDFWAPNNREFFPNIEVKIYDRYGRVVAILDQVAKWDGKYEGTELPSGDYWYEVNANDKSKIRYVGHFTLYR